MFSAIASHFCISRLVFMCSSSLNFLHIANAQTEDVTPAIIQTYSKTQTQTITKFQTRAKPPPPKFRRIRNHHKTYPRKHQKIDTERGYVKQNSDAPECVSIIVWNYTDQHVLNSLRPIERITNHLKYTNQRRDTNHIQKLQRICRHNDTHNARRDPTHNHQNTDANTYKNKGAQWNHKKIYMYMHARQQLTTKNRRA